jgi:serine/threonine protein kinase/formylglycine-generating enzyme required for sulfatase activity
MKECPTCRFCFADKEDYCPNDGAHLTFSFAGSVMLEDRYQLEQCIGRGGMGIVYKGRHILLKTLHAIKVILPELVGGDAGLVTRFRQEAMVAASIRHRNIVTVTDFGVVGEKMPFIVMDFIKGELLHEILEREGRLPADRAFEIMSAIAAGVGAAHQQGITHRDLKPLNVMLQENLPLAEGLKVLDFGLAKIKSGDIFGSFVMAQTTGLMGSPYYMAPEQWSEDEPDARADIYSMGIILYQMLAGAVPFRGPSVPVIMKKHMFDMPPPFASLGTHVAPEVDAVVRSCLEKDPSQRPQTVEELIRNLKEAIMRSEGAATYVVEKPTPVAKPRRASRAKGAKDKTAQSNPIIEADGVQTSKTDLEKEAARKKSEQARRLRAQQRAEQEARVRAEHESLLQAERARAEEEARKRAELERKLAEERMRAEEERRKQAELARRLKDEQERGYRSSMLSKLDETTPPPSLAPMTMPQMSLHPSAFLAASNPTIQPQPIQPQPTGMKDTFPDPPAAVHTPQPPSRFPMMMVGLAGGFVVVIAALVLSVYFLWPSSQTVDGNAPAPTSSLSNMVKVPGGSFMMGRDSVPDHALNEFPAHQVTVGSVSMDKTEVTCSAYSDCVKSGSCRRPPSWSTDSPPPGQDQWPVSSVSLNDAKAFASWRSKRDGVEYRLPTEEEWEYAARSGNSENLYPWGKKWIDSYANVGTKTPVPVGSYTQGATSLGMLDMIGNVWEWTSSNASIYAGNDKKKVGTGEENYYVIRGGCYASTASGEEAATATARRWLDASITNEYIGFRLVSAK